MIRADALRKSFGSTLAVDGVSLDIPQGETFGLLGPNGAGKTTTISMLTGLLRPDSGTVGIAGSHDPARPEVRRGIGVTPQTLAIYDELTARENLEFFGRLYALAPARLRERVEWALDFAGLADRQRHRVSSFSGGMKRRLNLACSLIHDPQVLLMDEPTVGVDPHSRNQIFESIEALQRGGRTILYTTHYMEEAQRLCGRVAIMDHGRILAMDTVPRLIEAHGGHATVEAEFHRAPEAGTELAGQLDGLSLRLHTLSPAREVARIANCGGELATLKVEQPDLETVFLNLTGRSLRD